MDPMIFTLCVVCLSAHLTYGRSEGSQWGHPTTVFVKESTPDVAEKRGGNEDFPDRMHVSFRVDGQDVDLDLEKNKHLNEDADLFVLRRGLSGGIEAVKQAVPASQGEVTRYYQDRKNGAAFSIHCHEINIRCEKHSLRGTFYVGDRAFEMVPDYSYTSERLISRFLGTPYLVRERKVRPVDTASHRVYPLDYLTDSSSDITDEENLEDMESILRSLLQEKRVFTAQKAFGVELALVLDYGLYQRWKSISGKDNVLRDMKRYYAHIMNGVDLRFGTIEDRRFSIYVRLVAYYICEESQMSSFTFNLIEEDVKGKQKINADNALRDLRGWIATSPLEEKHPDHVMCFTNYHMYSEDRYGRRGDVIGMAELRGICQEKGQSICANMDSFETMNTAAHELAHNLGAKHDGDGNRCRKDDAYIMTPNAIDTSASLKTNPYMFSKCSKKAMWDFLRKPRKTGCLRNGAKTGNIEEWNAHMQNVLGEIYSPDKQCQLFDRFEGSSFCQNKSPLNKICTEMKCASRNGGCFNPNTFRAARGTTCGQNKHCIEGKCKEKNNV